MNKVLLAAAAVAGVLSFGAAAHASTFAGFTETTDVFFDGGAEFDYDPFFLGGSISESSFVLNLALSPDLGTGSLLLTDDLTFSTVLEGDLEDTALQADGAAVDDTFSMLFSLTTGSTDFAIATFTGDLDGFGTTDFLTDGVFFEPGNLTIVGATQDQTTVVPLPAGLPLLLAGIGALFHVRRRQF